METHQQKVPDLYARNRQRNKKIAGKDYGRQSPRRTRLFMPGGWDGKVSDQPQGLPLSKASIALQEKESVQMRVAISSRGNEDQQLPKCIRCAGNGGSYMALTRVAAAAQRQGAATMPRCLMDRRDQTCNRGPIESSVYTMESRSVELGMERWFAIGRAFFSPEL